MEIEIVTTKKKISATIIKQFKRITFSEIEGAECLGYVINILKDVYKTYIIKLANGEYRMLEYGWYTNNTTRIYKNYKKGTAQIDLGSTNNAKDFIAFLQNCDKSNQIII